jgi:hypothetical protein
MTTKPTSSEPERGEMPYRSFRLCRTKPSQPGVGVPRRFSIGTMMIFTAMFAVLFSVLKTLDVSPVVFVFISVFFAGVAACQAILFKGKNPRTASIVGGSVLFYLMMVVIYFSSFTSRTFPKNEFISLSRTFLLLLAGAWAGYIAGILIAAVFLVRKEPDDAPPPPNEAEIASRDHEPHEFMPKDRE